MPPIFHLILLLLAMVCFALSAWIAGSPTPEPMWKRLVSLGLAFLSGSMVQW